MSHLRNSANVRALCLVVQAALAMAALCPARAGAGEQGKATEEVWLETNLRDLYPRLAEVCVATYDQMRGRPGVVIVLRNEVESFSHYRYALRRDSLPAGPIVENRSGRIPITFDPLRQAPQRVTAVVQGVSSSGRMSRLFSIELGYTPAAVYAASKQKSRNWVVVRASDLSLCSGSVDDWIVETTSAADRAYARKRWGRLVESLESDYDRARAIARDLVRALHPHEGIPSGAMQHLSGLEQLARAESGRDHVWCGNYADIFSAACNALDIPVRKIDMQYLWSTHGSTSLEVGEGHRTTEVFDRSLNRWIWMDLTFGHWQAYLDDGVPVSVFQLARFLSDERRRDRLRIVEFDPDRGSEQVVHVRHSKHGKDLVRFFRQDQRYKYIRRAPVAAN